ncbi:dolichyl-P-Man:Man(5)GlcNAc(2)-PP-dolichyl mannosyltransferase [Coprinellus micaceus]|uniref:Dol-P-Man:Man(5)GlcNAc(2)-PP-Dol alpha-1,3-mannosyltransferase n=1 Tax=Coprinellus micaceus TaxID=71717 RepID=A0A4Y7TPT1_COPMI|nr:dolichyl-P-Man:Man(5)GlcNAc(2)-PP-dolichyl mannosyltransferase [Coprinellus micaceus]
MSSMSNWIRSGYRLVLSLLTDPKHFWKLAALVIIGDAVLTQLIITVIPYTEIDWETYMVQTGLYLKGEHDYSKISGPTGPLVYPAGHVRIHQVLYALTNGGKNMRLAQHIYGALYIATLALTCAIYRKARAVPNWLLILLPLSKRLHSIHALRMFNDCWVVLLSQLAILACQYGFSDSAWLLFSAAVSVKMSALLYLPGLLVISFKRRGPASTILSVVKLAATQVIIASPFLREHPWAYARGAFDLGRVFLYKWTVNWRFLREQTFLDHRMGPGPDGAWPVLSRGWKRPLFPAALGPITPDYIATVLFTSNLIGILFARSLHYQFYSWYAQQLPFLAWKTKYPIAARLVILTAIEYAWNVFPSTTFSSSILLLGNSALLLGVWFGEACGKDVTARRS